MNDHRKKVKHYHVPGHFHELTFSCHRRMALLNDDVRCRLLCESIDKAVANHSFRIAAFVIMPEHVHLLVYPENREYRIDKLLYAIKRPFSYRVKLILIEENSILLKALTIRERPGKWSFRFWMEGPGYDRNLYTEKSIMAATDYIHRNPVRRGLVETASMWKWSSMKWYESNGMFQDDDLPTIHGIPWDVFS